MDDSRIRRVFSASKDDPNAGIKAGDQVIEFVDGTARPRRTWRRILDDLVQLPEKNRVDAIHDAAELEASVINFLSRENSPWRKVQRQELPEDAGDGSPEGVRGPTVGSDSGRDANDTDHFPNRNIDEPPKRDAVRFILLPPFPRSAGAREHHDPRNGSE